MRSPVCVASVLAVGKTAADVGSLPSAQSARFAALQKTRDGGISARLVRNAAPVGEFELFRFAVGAMAAAKAAIFAELKPSRGLLFVFLRVIISALAFRTSHRDHHSLLFLRHFPVSQDVGASAEHERNGRAVRSGQMIPQGLRHVNSVQNRAVRGGRFSIMQRSGWSVRVTTTVSASPSPSSVAKKVPMTAIPAANSAWWRHRFPMMAQPARDFDAAGAGSGSDATCQSGTGLDGG